MTGNYRLASLDVASIYDEPAVPLELPGRIETGTDPALAILEGGFRSPTLASRFTFPAGLVGIQLPRGELPEVLQVRLQVRLDRTGDERWTTRMVRQEDGKVLRGVAATRNVDPAGRHRLVHVWVQGRSRAVALLSAGPEGKGVRQRLALDVPTRELDESRLLMLSFTTGTTAWNTDHELDDSLVGISLPWVEVGEPDAEVQATVSTGTAVERGFRTFSPETGLAVVNPVSGAAPTRLEVRAPAVEAGHRRLLGRRTRPEEPAGLVAEVTDLAGAALPVPAPASVAPGRFQLELPAHDGPLLLRLRAEGETVPSVPYALRVLPRR